MTAPTGDSTWHAYAVTAVGPDAPGEIAALAEALAALGANLEDASMTRLRGHFAMTLVTSAPASQEQLETALGPVAERTGLHVTVWPVEPVEPPPAGSPWRVTAHGADRPGLVARVAGTVAAYGGNITDLGCRLAGELYVITVEADLPSVEGVERALTAVGEELGLTVHLEPVDEDVL
jgi:glycine cleavage system transcriptional repressor